MGINGHLLESVQTSIHHYIQSPLLSSNSARMSCKIDRIYHPSFTPTYWTSSPANPSEQYRMHVNDLVMKRLIQISFDEPKESGPQHDTTWEVTVTGERP